MAVIQDLVLTFCPTMRSVLERKLKLLMLVWNEEFRSEYSNRNKWTTSRGDPEYSGRKKPNSDRNFRNLWHNGKHPLIGYKRSVIFQSQSARVLIHLTKATARFRLSTVNRKAPNILFNFDRYLPFLSYALTVFLSSFRFD